MVSFMMPRPTPLSDLPAEGDRCSEAGFGEGRAAGTVPGLGLSWQEVCSPGRGTDSESHSHPGRSLWHLQYFAIILSQRESNYTCTCT